MGETGQEPAAACEAPNASTREMDDTDGGGEVSQIDTDDVQSISDGEARGTRRRSSPSDPTRETKTTCWQDMLVSGLGAVHV